ncbi:NAD(P)/FAD-dependent oxidoreductase [Paraglaciecola sp. 2405UD69-4]|uniref:NAD(P)/FAD-dependent oxidoreductase n=1 Tax=Paraglaciecola sp. 2405UD69-4 TaxID=3391836 RepID=UPI0039C8DABD
MNITTHTLIIGGGFAGATLAQELAKSNIATMLIDCKDYFEVTMATLRNIADFAKVKDTPRIRYRDFLSGEFIQGRVTELTEQTALLENGDSISFQQAVIATGSSYPSFSVAKSNQAFTLEARNQELKSASLALEKAQSVLIIGAGAVGVELAGDIAYSHPNIKVTLADSGTSVLGSYSEKTQQKASKQLQALGVNIQTNRYYQQHKDVYIDKNSGEELAVDIAYVAVGVKANSDFMKAHLNQYITDKGFIKVNDDFQVTGTKTLWAIGDVADLKDLKLAAAAIPQGKELAANLVATKQGKKTKAHKPMPEMGLIPIGQEKGVAQIPIFGTVTWKPLINFKNKDLLIGYVFKGLGIK